MYWHYREKLHIYFFLSYLQAVCWPVKIFYNCLFSLCIFCLFEQKLRMPSGDFKEDRLTTSAQSTPSVTPSVTPNVTPHSSPAVNRRWAPCLENVLFYINIRLKCNLVPNCIISNVTTECLLINLVFLVLLFVDGNTGTGCSWVQHHVLQFQSLKETQT